MYYKKLTEAISLFAALSIALAALLTVVSPMLDLDCGVDPAHSVANVGKASDATSGVPSDAPASPCDHSATPAQPGGQGNQEGQAVHVHGMNSQALPGISMVAMDFGVTPFLIPTIHFHLSDATVQPPTKPPRISV